MTPEQAAASAAWLKANRPDMVSQQNTAAQAAALNAAYQNNSLPVLPQYAKPAYTQAEQQDAANEAAKHQRLFHPQEYYGSNFSGMTLSQIASRYGSTAADYVQDKARENPSAAFTDINRQYQQQHGGVSAQNPYDPNSALGIGWEVARTGGATDTRLNLIAEASTQKGGRYEGADASFLRYATDIYQERPQFAREVLTTKTGQQFTNKEWAGVPIRMNLTRDEAQQGGGITGQNFGGFLRYNPETYTLNRLESGAGAFGVDSGVHKARGDFGGPILGGGTYGGWRSGGVNAAAASLPNPFVSTSQAAIAKPFLSTSQPAIAQQGSPFGVLGAGLGALTDLYGFGSRGVDYIRTNSPEAKQGAAPAVAPMFQPFVSGAQNTASNMLSNVPAAASGWFGGAVETARKTAAFTPMGAWAVGTPQEKTAAYARGERLNMWTDVLGVGMIGGGIKGAGKKVAVDIFEEMAKKQGVTKFNPANIQEAAQSANYVNPGLRVKSLQNAADELFTAAGKKLKAGVNIIEPRQSKGFVPSDIEATKRPSLTIKPDASYRPDWLKEMYKGGADFAGSELKTASKKKDDIVKGVAAAAGGWFASQQKPVQDLWNNTPTVVKSGGLMVGSTAFASGAGAFGAGTELGLGGVFASNPVGWGLGIGAGATMLAETSGRLGLTGKTKEFSVRTAGEMYGGVLKQRASEFQTVWKSGSGLAASGFNYNVNMAKAAGASLMGAGTGLYRGAEGGFGLFRGNEAGAAGTRTFKGELGSGVFKGQETGRGLFTGNEAGTGLWKPTANNYANHPATSNKNNYIDEFGTSYPNPAKTRNPVGNEIGFPTGTPTGNPFKNPIDTPYKNPNKYPFGTPVGTPYVPTNIFKTPTGTGTGTPTVPEYGYDYPTNPNPPTTPKIKIPELPLITLPGWPGGSESRGGGSGRGRGAMREMIGIRSSLDWFGSAPKARAPRKAKRVLVTLEAPRRATPRRATPQKAKRKRR